MVSQLGLNPVFHFQMITKKKKMAFFIILVFMESVLATLHPEILKGQHLIIAAIAYPIALTEVRNSSGYIIEIGGISALMLDWLSLRYGFSYSVLQINKTSIEGSSISPGYFSYLANGKCDLMVGGMATLYSRLVFMDFTHGFLYASNIGLMIPMPDASINVSAILKPFQMLVWIGIICALSSVLVALYFLLRFSKHFSNERNGENPVQMETDNASIKKSNHLPKFSLLYIVEVILSQGGYCPDKRLFIRWVTMVWCLAAFVLISSYNSLLVSYLISPNAEPLIHDMKDLSNVSKIHLVVDAGKGFDIGFSKSNYPDGSIYNQLKNKLRDYPNSRCLKTENCVSLVKSGNHVYINSVLAILDVMKKDLQSTGKCNLALAKEKEYASPWSWALAKNSPYLEYFNQGILEMRDFGLLDFWAKWYQPNVRQCLEKADNIMQLKKSSKKDSTRLSLNNLTGAFVVLIVGYLVSFVAFLAEKINAIITAR